MRLKAFGDDISFIPYLSYSDNICNGTLKTVVYDSVNNIRDCVKLIFEINLLNDLKW